MVERIGQRHGGRYGHTISRVDTHRVEVLNRTDDDEVSLSVAQQFQFVFFPTHDALFYQNFMDGGGNEAVLEGFVKFFGSIDKTATRSSQGERRTDYQRKPDFLRNFLAFEERFGGAAFTNPRAQFQHFKAEFLTVFGGFDGFDIHPYDLDTVFFPNTGFVAINGQI